MIASAEEFYRLRISENPVEYSRAAKEEATLETWLEVIKNYPEMKKWVAQNKTVPLEILKILSEDSDVEVRCFVAMKRDIPEVMQLKLAKDEDETVRHRIACNRKASRAALELLSNDAVSLVRDSATEHLKLLRSYK